jgi:hypothetical protein
MDKRCSRVGPRYSGALFVPMQDPKVPRWRLFYPKVNLLMPFRFLGMTAVFPVKSILFYSSSLSEAWLPLFWVSRDATPEDLSLKSDFELLMRIGFLGMTAFLSLT